MLPRSLSAAAHSFFSSSWIFIFVVYQKHYTRLRQPSLVTTRWSTSDIPSSSPASFRRLATSLSAVLGSRLPLGWLWVMITDAARSVMTSAKTSRGWTRLAVRVPMVMMRLAMRRLAPSSVRQTKYACFLSRISVSCSTAFLGLSIIGRS